uniref:Trafficking protein particle complex subunit 10 n=1 Tax=Aegilops tauschii TaxID=37682 RepID=M8B821_AEGTA
MANYLAQFQTIKSSSDRIVIAVEDVSDLWLNVKDSFEQRLPVKKACLNNKARNPVLVENLPAEFIQTTDSRLRSRFPQEQYLFWFREPYATVVLVTCEDLDEFKTILKPRLKLIVQNDEREWFIVFVSKAHPSNDQATKMAKKVYARLEADFNTKKRERCCKFDLHGPDDEFWDDFDSKMVDCIRNTLDKRVQFYEEENRRLSEQRFTPIWNFCNFFILKESLAFMFEVTNLHEDSLREYDELELCYSESVNLPGKPREFGGLDTGDDQAALLNPGFKALTQIVQDDVFREFEFRQYIFACQAKLLFKLSRPVEVAARGYAFVVSFSKTLALHEFMRLAYLIGYGVEIEKSPVNSASLSMLSWPKPATWPSIPPDSSAETILQAKAREKLFDIQRKPLPLEPSSLLREANRRRAFLSVGNLSELYDSVDGSGLGAHSKLSPNKSSSNLMTRTMSGPATSETSLPVDRPMRLSEIHVAAEHALKQTISDPDFMTSLSSPEEFESRYMELTKGAADNYHRSWWKRHGVVLDGEIAAIFFKHGNYDLAAKSYEKVCALYSAEGWEELLADVLPDLAECQKILKDEAGYLASCVKLLSLESSLFSSKERQAFQSEVVRLAHSEMRHPVPLDVSSLITFAGNPAPPLELCDGDPGTLSVAVWSGFPDDITLESLSLRLSAFSSADEGLKAIRSTDARVLVPGRNIITFDIPPQKPGSYVLGALTGQIGKLSFRSHGFSQDGPVDTDEFMSFEKPTRPVLKVRKPRALVDITPAVSSALLMNELQWIGLIVKPIDYSLKGGILHIDAGAELKIEESQMIEIESYRSDGEHSSPIDASKVLSRPTDTGRVEKVPIENGKIKLPDWASDVTTLVWFPVRAINDTVPKGTSPASPQKHSIVDGMRMIALKLEFGAFHNQIFERTIAVHFTNPFHVSTRVVDKCNDGTLLLQVILHSEVKATLHVKDVSLDLQAGFEHLGKGDGRPTSSLFPLVIAPSSKAGILFVIRLSGTKDLDELEQADSMLHIKYGISGDRATGAHSPVPVKPDDSEELLFKISLKLKRPVLDPCLAVGFLPFSTDCLRVGQLVNMKWRVERLKDLEEASLSDDEILYQVDANPQNWMVAGRKSGHISFSEAQGSRIEIAVTCVPLVSGYVHPPQLGLPDVGDANISCNPAGPHLQYKNPCEKWTLQKGLQLNGTTCTTPPGASQQRASLQ